MTRFTDPIGPGTPAWDNFDKALDMWCQAGPQPPHGQRKAWRTSKTMKRYYNVRQEMIRYLRKHGGNVQEWLAALEAAKADPDMIEVVAGV